MQKVRAPMQDDRKSLTPVVIAGVISISLLVMMLITAGMRPAAATPKFAEWTSQACDSCHSKPAKVSEMLITASRQPAAATPEFAALTRQTCDSCHSKPAILNERGKNFARTLPLWER
jgi:hypothetical protein